MKVALVDWTGKGMDQWYAADLLLFAKSTRLKMSPDGLDAIRAWPEEKKLAELAYAAGTIRSAWEHVSYCFMMEDVTRAFTHQLVRHRSGSFSQQTQQVLRIDASAVKEPAGLVDYQKKAWREGVAKMAETYDAMLAAQATVEQARGILPQNVLTNILARFDLRALVDVIHQRVSPRNLGEFRDAAMAMRDAVLEVHPWAAVFLERTQDKAMEELDGMISAAHTTDQDMRNRMHKLVDQIRRGS